MKYFSGIVAVFILGSGIFAEEAGMAKLLYQGHGSYRITSAADYVIYVDPYAGKGYNVPADLVLVTHEHQDHNAVNLVIQKKGCMVIREKNVLVNGIYRKIDMGKGITVQAVPAYNSNHDRTECVGYVITVDGIVIYASGDTSYTDYMKDTLSKEHINYALLPCDGVFNMDAKEAARCADIIGAKHVIPVHMKPGALFDQSVADRFTAKNRLIVKPGEEITLTAD